jgi:hypothetical protein
VIILKTAKIQLDLAKYRIIRLPIKEALELLRLMESESGGAEVTEAIRIVENFSVFYEMLNKKQRDYIPLPHDYSDLIRGRVSIDKIRLEKSGDQDIVVLVFDRRYPMEKLEEMLRKIGFEEVIIEKSF